MQLIFQGLVSRFLIRPILRTLKNHCRYFVTHVYIYIYCHKMAPLSIIS